MEPGKDLRLFCHWSSAMQVLLGSTENIKKALSSYYFCQNETLYIEGVNGLFSKNFFLYFTDNFSLYSVRQKIYPPCNSKTLYVVFTDSRQESIEAKVRDEISLLLGNKKKYFSTGLNELYLPMQLTV
jgi:hypothetical protein